MYAYQMGKGRIIFILTNILDSFIQLLIYLNVYYVPDNVIGDFILILLPTAIFQSFEITCFFNVF